MKTCIQVICSGLALVIAILAGIILHLSSVPSGVHIRLDSTTITTGTTTTEHNSNNHKNKNILLGSSISSLTQQQVEEYYTNGVVLIKGLVSPKEAIQLKDAARKATSQLFSVFSLFPGAVYKQVMFDLWRTSPQIASLSLQGLPIVASSLMKTSQQRHQQQQKKMEIDNDDENHSTTITNSDDDEVVPPFRLLRDAYFEYAPPSKGCGWHIDDAAFWPSDEEIGGPTFWIALDPSSPQEGGGLAILNRTAFQETEPLHLTEEVCRQSIVGATCNMLETSPGCHAKMEASKIEFHLSPGDAIVWDRWTFHRGVAATDEYPHGVAKQRYTVRYIPHGARAYGAIHQSVQQGSVIESPYYPQVWPTLLESEMKALENGLDQDLTLLRILQSQSTLLARRWVSFLYSKGNDAVTNALTRKPSKEPSP